MKNKFKSLLVVIFLYSFLCMPSSSFSKDFIFKVSELEILDQGNRYLGTNDSLSEFGYRLNKRGTATTSDNLKIIAETFDYNKLTNVLEAFGNVEIIDSNRNIKIYAEKIFYFKNEEKIFTVGKTKALIENEYTFYSDNVFLFRDTMILSSDNFTKITDDELNVYNLDKFEFSINDEILKADNAKIIYKDQKFENDKYFFETLFVNLKTKRFLGKDVDIKFNKMMYDNTDNDPRIKGATGYGDEFNTYIDNGLFTICKKTDKCPPWLLKSKNFKHDKIKRQMVYKNAWLKVYDVPVLYFPRFFHPDPTVKRQSGFLKPMVSNDEVLGRSLYAPYFQVISKDKDITFKPRIYLEDKYVLQSEYRQAGKNFDALLDFSLTTGHDSSSLDKGDSRGHFFGTLGFNLESDNFIRRTLDFKLQSSSNDTYIKLFKLESPIIPVNFDSLMSSVKLDLEHDDYDFTGSFERYESLNGAKKNDKYQYILPTYNFTKYFEFQNIDGLFHGLNLSHSASNSLTDTNQVGTSISNQVSLNSVSLISDLGIKNKISADFQNSNLLGKKHSTYKSSPQSELISSYALDVEFPLIKEDEYSINTIIPKALIKFNPHEMINHYETNRRINIDNVFNHGRLSFGDTYEAGESLTLGVDYRLEKRLSISETIQNEKNEDEGLDDVIKQKYFDFKLATVLRPKFEENIPYNSTLNRTSSNVFGKMVYGYSDNLTFEYDFSVDNDLSTFEYNSLDTIITVGNLITEFNFIEENGALGDSNSIANTTLYNIDENNKFKFSTRRNRKINLTEYYNLIYEYENDCLKAGLQYKKNYYSDRDIKPTEELFFSITIIPLTKYQPENVLRLFD